MSFYLCSSYISFIFQIFIAFFRCDKDHPKRFIFNYFHRSLGLLTFLLSSKTQLFERIHRLRNQTNQINFFYQVATMYLGVFIDKMELGNVGWAILAGWTFWILVFPLILETLELIFASPSNSSSRLINALSCLHDSMRFCDFRTKHWKQLHDEQESCKPISLKSFKNNRDFD